MDVPAHLRFSADHQWAKSSEVADSKLIRVGITDYAQDALGDVIFVDLPTVGDAVQANEPMGEVESTKSVSDLFAPVSGVVVSINDALEESPQLINEDPYGEGWVCELELEDTNALSGLLAAAAYLELTGEE